MVKKEWILKEIHMLWWGEGKTKSGQPHRSPKSDGTSSSSPNTDLFLGIKIREITLPTKVRLVKAMAFPVVMYWCESCTIKKCWTPKTWWFQIAVLEKILESPLDWKEIKLANPKGNQPKIFIGRTDAEALIFWSPDAKSWLLGKGPDIKKDWRQKEKGTTENKMFR